MNVAEEEPSLFTVGHSNHALEEFLALLERYEIETLIDVRTQPMSSYSPHFNARPLREAIEAAGIRYGFYGRELGGRPDDPALYDEAGHVLYGEVARTPLFADGLTRLEKGLQRFRVAIMCSEEDPMICHRRLLVSRVLNERGVAARHIRGDGRLQTERWEDWQAAEAAKPLDLFAEEETEREKERREWKSLQSVSPKRPPNISSGD